MSRALPEAVSSTDAVAITLRPQRPGESQVEPIPMGRGGMCRRYVCLFCSLQGGQTLQASLFFRLGKAPLLSLFRDALCLRFPSCPLGLLSLLFDKLLGARLQLAAQHRNMPQKPQMLLHEQSSITLRKTCFRE